MSSCDFGVTVEGDISVVKVRGDLDGEAAAHLLDTAAAAAKVSRAVQIDLQEARSVSEDAAAALVFRNAPWRSLPNNIVLRTKSEGDRQAVLRGFARHRARSQGLTAR